MIQLEKQILGAICNSKGWPGLRVVNVNWEGIELLSQSMPQLNIQIEQAKKAFQGFDVYLCFRKSPIQ